VTWPTPPTGPAAATWPTPPTQNAVATWPTPPTQNAADSIDAARRLVDGHPFLSEGKGRFSVEIFELVPM
jgi:hypothetical protein